MFVFSNEYKERIISAQKNPSYITASGVSVDEIKKFVLSSFDENSKSVPMLRARLFDYILSSAQIAYEEGDIFTCDLNHGNALRDLRDKYHELLLEKVYSKQEQFRDGYDGRLFFGGADWGHQTPVWQTLYDLGISGIIEKAQTIKEKAISEKAQDFYDTVIIAYRAFKKLLLRAAENIEKFDDENSLALAVCLKNLSTRPPKSLYEALELTLIYYRVTTEIEGHNIRSLGSIDLLWKPFYEADLASGKSEKELDDLIAAFFVRLEAFDVTANVPVMIGGKDAKGNPAYSYFSEKLVDIFSSLNIISPKIHVKYNSYMPQTLAEKVCSDIIKGNSSYLFINDETVISSLVKVGIDEKECYDYTVIGCYEPVATGVEACSTCNIRVMLPKLLELVLNDGIDPYTGKLIGEEVALDKIKSIDDLLFAVEKKLDECVEIFIKGTNEIENNYDKETSSPMLSATYESAMERGVDLYHGGVKYSNSGVHIMGIATLVDSLCAIKKLVYDEKRLLLKEFNKILLSNWDGNEILRLYCVNRCEKYGNGMDYPDELASQILAYCSKKINGRKNGKGGIYKTAYFSVGHYFEDSFTLGATANGRRKGEPISKNMCATDGCDENGLTALINSLCKIDYTLSPDGAILDFIVHPSVVCDEMGAQILFTIIKTYFARGGFAIHGNVFDYTTLEKARQNPEKYKSLQVRVCGWNAYFIKLSDDEQKHFIEKSKATK